MDDLLLVVVLCFHALQLPVLHGPCPFFMVPLCVCQCPVLLAVRCGRWLNVVSTGGPFVCFVRKPHASVVHPAPLSLVDVSTPHVVFCFCGDLGFVCTTGVRRRRERARRQTIHQSVLPLTWVDLKRLKCTFLLQELDSYPPSMRDTHIFFVVFPGRVVPLCLGILPVHSDLVLLLLLLIWSPGKITRVQRVAGLSLAQLFWEQEGSECPGEGWIGVLPNCVCCWENGGVLCVPCLLGRGW